MTIDVYSDFKIKVKSEYNTISQEDSMPNDYVFSKDCDYTEEIVNGGVLLEILRFKLSNSDISEISIKGNNIKIENFDPSSGESSTIEMNIRRVKR